jgi:hypothetical protein
VETREDGYRDEYPGMAGRSRQLHLSACDIQHCARDGDGDAGIPVPGNDRRNDANSNSNLKKVGGWKFNGNDEEHMQQA